MIFVEPYSFLAGVALTVIFFLILSNIPKGGGGNGGYA